MPAISTLGEAHDHGWTLKVYCRDGYLDSRDRRSKSHCQFSYEPDMMTLLWTRGRAFPLSRLPVMLKCPRCANRNIQIMFNVPSDADRRPTAAARRIAS